MEASQLDHNHHFSSRFPQSPTNLLQEPDYFAFLRTDQQQKHPKSQSFFSKDGLGQDLIQVTQAEPDLCLEVFYALYHVFWPQIEHQSDISLKDAWTRFIGGSVYKGILCPPEKLVLERRVQNLKRRMSKPGGETEIFHDLDGVVDSILNLKQKTNDYSGEILSKKEVIESLSLVEQFYLGFRSQVKALVQTILEKERVNAAYGSESEALEDLLEPKAVMTSDIFDHHWAYRIQRSQAQKLLALDMHGRTLKNNIKDLSNHRVIALPEKSNKPLVFFKANGNPPMEFMLYSLYQHLQIPNPETALLVLTNVFEANPEDFYSIQASEAVNGESSLKACQDQETIFDHEVYVSQVFGAFLTNPSNGSFKNCKYSSEYKALISIDNNEVFKPEIIANLDDNKIVNVKSILYLLPQIDLPIPKSIQTYFTTLDPQLTTLSWLQDLSRKNKEYKNLFSKLAFQKTHCYNQNLLPQNEVPELHNKPFCPQIFVSQALLRSLTEKVQLIEDNLLKNPSISTQGLFEEISPDLGKYYRKLRFECSGPEEAEQVLWGDGENDYFRTSSLLDHEEVNNLLSNNNELNEKLPPETFFKEYHDLLASGPTPLDRFIERHSQRKNKKVLNLQIVQKELQLLVQEGFTNFQSPRDIVDFCHSLSKMTDNDPSLIKRITALFSNLPHPELQWLFTLEKYFLRPECSVPNDLMPSSVPIFGALMKQRVFILSESENQYLFDHKGNIKKNTSLTGRSSVTYFPEKDPQFYLKQYPEWPGYEFASTLFMRLLGIQHLPFHDLLIVNSKYPALLTQKVSGDPVHCIWHNPQAFQNLNPVHTTLLIISAMLINPEDGKEDNFILSHDGKYLIPIDNDHCFLPSFSQNEGKFWNFWTVNTTLQTKTLLFCLDEMNKSISLEVKQQILSLNFDELLTKWMTELDKLETKFNNLVDQSLQNTFLEQGTVLRIPFYKPFIQNISWKVHKIQEILKIASKVTPFDLLKAVEPFAAKCYQDSFKQGSNLQSRFKAATDQLYKKTTIDGSRVSIINTKSMMEIINLSEKGLQTDIMFQRMGPVDALELLNHLIQERSRKAIMEQEILCELDEKKQENQWVSLFGDPPVETALKAFFANPKQGLLLRGSRLITTSRLAELFAQAPHVGVKIRFLSLPESPSLTDKEIKILIEECPNLEYLNVSGCVKLNQISAGEGEWPLLIRLEARDCLNLKKIVSYSPMKILRIETDQEIEIFVEKTTLDIVTISKKTAQFEFSFNKGKSLEIKSGGQIISNDDFLHHVIRGKEEIQRYFRNFKVTMNIHSILAGKNLGAFITFLQLKNSNIKTEDIQRMVQLNLINLRSLGLSKTGIIGRDSIQYLIQGEWPNLEQLDLSANAIYDEGVAILSRRYWPLLENLDLQDIRVTSVGIQDLVNNSKWPRLKHLNLSENPEINDKALEFLSNANWPLLEILGLKGTGVTTQKLLKFIFETKFSSLKEIIFDSNKKKLLAAFLPLLPENLDLSYCKITQDELEVIMSQQNWLHLKSLNLSQNEIKNEGVELLSKGDWPLLETLDLTGTEITMKGVEVIVKKCYWPRLKDLGLSFNQIDNEALAILCQGNWPNLEILKLSHTQITKKALSSFLLNANWPNLKTLTLPNSWDETDKDLASQFIKKDLSQLEKLDLNELKITLAEIKPIIKANKSQYSKLKYFKVCENDVSCNEKISVLTELRLLEEVHLENTKLSPEGLQNVVSDSKWLRLKYLNLSHNDIFDQGLSVLAFGRWPFIKELNLKNTKITLQGIKHFQKEMKFSNLNKLNVSNNEIFDEPHLFQYFASFESFIVTAFDMTWLSPKRIHLSITDNENLFMVPRAKWDQLESIKLSFNDFRQIQSIVWPPNLKILDLSNNLLFDENQFEGLFCEKCPFLKGINFQNTGITPKHAAHLIKKFDWSHMKKLDISLNPIQDEGLEIFLSINWPSLVDFSFKNTNITAKGLEIFINNRNNLPNLKRVDISHNPIQDEGLEILVSSNWTQLEYLSLEKTEITYKGIEVLIGKSHWPNLRGLDISDNRIWDEGIKTLSSGNWPLLESLYLRKLAITGSGIESLTSISEWPSLKILDLSENTGMLIERLHSGKWPLLEYLFLKNTTSSPYCFIQLLSNCSWPRLKEIHFQSQDYLLMQFITSFQSDISKRCPNAKIIVSQKY